MVNVEEFFSEVRTIVDAALDRLVPTDTATPARLYKAIRWSLFGGGKRLRPALVFATGRVFGAGDERLLRTATAVEMIHSYSLIHDDLPSMDDDDLRRGRETCHKKFGEATAILAGDALQAMAFESIANDLVLSPQIRLQLISELSAAAGRMVAGQQLDLEAEGKPLDLEEIEQIHLGKTAALIRFSIRSGGLISGADDEELQGLTSFGEKLGLLFQITDDILDLTGSSENLGKTAGKDAISEKATYAGLLGVGAAGAAAAEIAQQAIDDLGQRAREDRLLADICIYIADRSS